MRKIIDLCKEVPLLPIVILAAIPLALIPSWRPWGHIHSAFDPGVGEWIVILLLTTVCAFLLGGCNRVHAFEFFDNHLRCSSQRACSMVFPYTRRRRR